MSKSTFKNKNRHKTLFKSKKFVKYNELSLQNMI